MKKTAEEFRNWIEKKISVEFNDRSGKDIIIGELWRYYEGMNVGNEISKDNRFVRVCLVINNNLGNGLVLVAPITTKYHKWMEKQYVEIENFEKFYLKKSRVLLNQIKMIDKKRFSHKLSQKRLSVDFVKEVLGKYCKLVFPEK